MLKNNVDMITNNECIQSCGIPFVYWISNIINIVVDFFSNIYHEYDCVKDVVDRTNYITSCTYNTVTNCKCEPYMNTWISSNIVDVTSSPHKFFDIYTILEDFDISQLRSYFITVLNNKQNLDKNEFIIMKGYDETREKSFYICRQPTNTIHTDYQLNYSSVHFLCVNYKNKENPEYVSLAIDKSWCIVGNEILGYTHVLRMLNYQSNNYVFSMDYVLEIIDSNIKVFEMRSDEFIRIGENDYSVEKIISDSESDSCQQEPIEF
jgi:hypothetical protein